MINLTDCGSKKKGGHSNLHHGSSGESRSDIEKQIKEGIEHPEKEHQQQPANQLHTNQCPEKKWVHILTNHALTEAQEKVLAHGPNFAVVANQPPTGEYIAQIERICQKINKRRQKS